MALNVLKIFGLEPVTDEETLQAVYGDNVLEDNGEKLQAWLSLLPNNITAQIDAALRQERPFLPPDVTPEMMATQNAKVPSMNHMQILYRCVDLAMKAEEFKMAACLAFVVDRASYWSGMSKALLKVVDLIKEACPEAAIAPQVQVRRARVLKDDGDLHGAMRVLDKVLERPKGLPGEWQYQDNDQYVDTKAEIIKIKGHILHNLGLMKESVEPFLESVRLFGSLKVPDDKGIASALGLLTKCLGKLSLEEYEEVRQKFPDYFKNLHPCYESYVQGTEAYLFIQSLQESLYSSRHMLDADMSLLKYAILQPSLKEEYKLFETIRDEMKRSLGAHKTVDSLRSSEQFYEFVRALFMISLTLFFSPVPQDQELSEDLQILSMELYQHLCNHNSVQQAARLDHTAVSVRIMNLALNTLSLPSLTGWIEEETKHEEGNEERKAEERRKYEVNPGESKLCQNLPKSDSDVVGDKQESSNVKDTTSQDRVLLSNDTESKSIGSSTTNSKSMSASDGVGIDVSSNSLTIDSSSLSSDISSLQQSADVKSSTSLSSRTEPSLDSARQFSSHKYETVSSRQDGVQQKENLRGWTYTFGYRTQQADTRGTQGCQTFPQVNPQQVLDPTKQWQTYRHKCVGLPVDPEYFASPLPTTPDSYEAEADVSSLSDGDVSDHSPLVNLSESFIQQTVENKSKKSQMSERRDVVDRLATTEDTSESMDSDWFFRHPHDLPDQPMRIPGERKRVDADLDISELPPLVDRAKTTDSLDKILGSFSTTESVDKETKHPLVAGVTDNSVQRAFLLSYNPGNGHWTSQSTLAFIGEPLDLAEGKKGNTRDAFNVQYLHQDEPRGRYVGKRYKKACHHNPSRYMQDVVCQMMAGYYVNKFNEALQNYKHDIQVQFLPAAHLQLLASNGHLVDFVNVEPYLHGEFIKLTDNVGFSNKKEHEGEILATAFTHFSFCQSNGTLMIVDIQGWLPRAKSGVIYLTDPQFHTNGIEKFSPYDHQERGMRKFWESVHPCCNDMCLALKLERPKK